MSNARNLSQGDTRFVNTSGDTMTGDLGVSNGGVHVTSPSGIEGLIVDTDQGNSAVSGRIVLKNNTSASSVYYSDSLGWTFHTGTVLGSTSGTQRMYLTPEGYLRTPYQPMMYGRSPRPGGGGYVSLGNNLYFSDLQLNVGNAWNNTTGTWTCPIAGKYMVYASLLIDQAAGTTDLCRAVFRHNGVEFVRGYDNSRTHTGGTGYYDGMMSFSAIRNCAANDTLDLQATDGFIHWGAESSFGIYLLA